MMNAQHIKKSTILVVDDKPGNLDVLIASLDEYGFTILVAQDGEEAYQLAQEFLPDIILLDVMMPGVDGFETCRRLKAHDMTHEIPVIFLTALSETVEKLKGFEVGGVDYITKPLQHEEVLARVNTHLMLRNLHRELQEKNSMLEEYAELLEKRNTEQKELNATKDKFFSIMAHDLRGPLGTLYGLTDVIVENIERYEKGKLIDMLVKQRDGIKNLFGLLENLLTWSRIQREMIEYYPQKLAVNDIFEKNVALLTPQAEQKQIALRNMLQEAIRVYADMNMLDTIVRNLLSNALKFTQPGGTVDMSAAQHDHHVEIAVSDTGIGISAQGISKLFRIDEQYQRQGTSNERGTGLGLILCKEFVEQHRGRIWVESEVGKGTTFRFTLPRNTT